MILVGSGEFIEIVRYGFRTINQSIGLINFLFFFKCFYEYKDIK